MGFFDFFRASPTPVEKYSDPALGDMCWSDDDEAWAGSYNGTQYLLAYGKTASPSEGLLGYVRSILADLSRVEDSLASDKAKAVNAYPHLAEEINSLRLGRFFFYGHKGTNRLLIDLDGGRDFRSWRCEFKGTTPEGIGFDD